jgi:hypothetical protein
MTSTRLAVTAGLLALTLISSAAFAQQDINLMAVPQALQAPAGNSPYLKASAEGTQNYICLPTATGFGWTFFAPEATLFMKVRWFNGEVKQQVTTHFLSPNPLESSTARATWQSSLDSSAVWGRAIANSSDPAFVQAGSIPWLLVQAVGTRRGPTGGSMLSETTYIQRVNTWGGVAPATGCSQASQVGTSALVPYTTDYVFYKADQ